MFVARLRSKEGDKGERRFLKEQPEACDKSTGVGSRLSDQKELQAPDAGQTFRTGTKIIPRTRIVGGQRPCDFPIY